MRMTGRRRVIAIIVALLICLMAASIFFVAGAATLAFLTAVAGLVIVLVWLAGRLFVSTRRRSSLSGRDATLETYRARQRRLFRQLSDVRDAAGTLPDAIVLLDTQGEVRWFNTAATRLLGLNSAHIGCSLADSFADTELGAWLKTTKEESHADMVAPADASLHLGLTLMPFGTHQQLVLGRDISRLSRLEKVRRDFVSNVSHELRTPLTVIYGYLELLDPEDVPDLAPMLVEMRMQSQRMRQIVEDLLTLSRLETGEALPDEDIDMLPVLEALRLEAEALSRGRHHISVEAGTTAHLRGSKHHLHSAFSNLVSNAARYTPSGGEIVIRWRKAPNGDAIFSVHDSGLGISSDQLSRLTERFYRVSSSRSRDSGGTGLGLSIVKHVLNLHQGRLVIESELGRGSTFSCVMDASRVLTSRDAETSV